MTIRVTALEGEEDHDATWMLGHTERIDFGPLFERDDELWCRAQIHVACRFLASGDDATSSRCTAWGFTGRVPQPRRKPAPRQLGRDRFDIVDRKKMVTRRIAPPAAPLPQLSPPATGAAAMPGAKSRALPLAPVASVNPCAAAKCRTSDLKRGDACCRDIQVDICCTPEEVLLEALIRNRKKPYLCKTERECDDQLLVEIISACSYLRPEGGCSLHGRTRSDGRPAKPLMCARWPEKRSGLHSGCAFKNRRLKV